MEPIRYIEVHVVIQVRYSQMEITKELSKRGIYSVAQSPTFIELTEHDGNVKYGSSCWRVSDNIMCHAKYMRPSAVGTFETRAYRKLKKSDELERKVYMKASRYSMPTYHGGLSHMLLVPENLLDKTMEVLPRVLRTHLPNNKGALSSKEYLPKGVIMRSANDHFQIRYKTRMEECKLATRPKLAS